jgi:FtsH-binding integral membrane protein
MTDSPQLKYLRIALVAVGIVFVAGIYPLMVIWPSGWAWHTGHSHYPMMIVGIYATLGAFLINAARNPLENLSLIWFTIWSSIVHGAIMAVQSIVDADSHGHLIGDVPALFIVAVVLSALVPAKQKIGALQHAH